MNNEQSLALRLAGALGRSHAEHDLFRDSGTELRRQHAEIERLRAALHRLLNSDPTGAIATATAADLEQAANDADADPVVREQAAAVLQGRAALTPNF